MGDASIIARLLANGHVQYGWSGNGGYFSMVGIRLLLWYQEPKNVEYLFSLGQTPKTEVFDVCPLVIRMNHPKTYLEWIT